MGTWGCESYSNDTVMDELTCLEDEDGILIANVTLFLDDLWENTLNLEDCVREDKSVDVEDDGFGREKLGCIIYILEEYPEIMITGKRLKEALYIAKHFASRDVLNSQGLDDDKARLDALEQEIRLIESHLP